MTAVLYAAAAWPPLAAVSALLIGRVARTWDPQPPPVAWTRDEVDARFARIVAGVGS